MKISYMFALGIASLVFASQLSAVAFAAAPPTVTLTSSASVVAPNSSIKLSWTTQNATECTATGNWQGQLDGNSSSVMLYTITKPSTYTLTCVGPDGTSTPATVKVGVLGMANTSSVAGAPATSAVTVQHSTSVTVSAPTSNSAVSEPASPHTSFLSSVLGFILHLFGK